MSNKFSDELLDRILNNESIPSARNSSSYDTEPPQGSRPITEGARPTLSTLDDRNQDK